MSGDNWLICRHGLASLEQSAESPEVVRIPVPRFRSNEGKHCDHGTPPFWRCPVIRRAGATDPDHAPVPKHLSNANAIGRYQFRMKPLDAP